MTTGHLGWDSSVVLSYFLCFAWFESMFRSAPVRCIVYCFILVRVRAPWGSCKGEMALRVPIVMMGNRCKKFSMLVQCLMAAVLVRRPSMSVVCCQCLHSSESREHLCLKPYPGWREAWFNFHCECRYTAIAHQNCFHSNVLDIWEFWSLHWVCCTSICFWAMPDNCRIVHTWSDDCLKELSDEPVCCAPFCNSRYWLARELR